MTTTMTIGELYLHVKSIDLAAQVLDMMVAQEFDVDVDYGVSEEEGRPFIRAIQASASVHFEGDAGNLTVLRGTNLMPLFSGPQVTALEDRIALMGNSDE